MRIRFVIRLGLGFKLGLFLVLILVLDSFSQKYTYRYRIQFKDKINTPFSVDNPSEYLSEKAILKRQKFNIKIDESDIPVNPAYIDSINKTGVRILVRSKWLNSVDIDSIHTDAITLNRIKSFPFVISVDTVAKYGTDKKSLKSEVRSQKNEIRSQTSDNRHQKSENDDFYKYGYSYGQINMIACDYLHDLGFKGQGYTIALLDGGFGGVDQLPIFDSLRANNRIIGTKNFVIPGDIVYTLSDHGMEVLSTIAGNIPGTYIGTAPEAQFWLLITEDVRSENIIEEDNWVAGAEFADSLGVDIINSSLGYTTFDYNLNNQSYATLNGKTARASIAATMAARKGMLVVNSAGNEGESSWKYIGVPADADSILSVGAVDMNGQYAPFSSQGPTYDGRIKPDVVAVGEGAALASSEGDIIFGNGTSFSSPIIAGLAACIWGTKPEATNIEVIDAIKKSASHYKNPDDYTGYGIPNGAAANLLLNSIQPPGTSSQQGSESRELVVLPNPFYDIINIIIATTDTNSVNLELYDLLGREVYNAQNVKKNSGYSYIYLDNVAELSKGIYFLKIYSSGKVYVRKLMKVN